MTCCRNKGPLVICKPFFNPFLHTYPVTNTQNAFWCESNNLFPFLAVLVVLTASALFTALVAAFTCIINKRSNKTKHETNCDY